MRQYVWTAAIVTCLLAFCSVAESRSLAKRQTEGINIDPLGQEAEEGSDDSGRDKRKVDAVTGVKSAVLGFVFNKLNSFIDQKTAWIDALDHTNIAKNKAHNIEPPKDPILSLSSIISGPKNTRFAWEVSTTPKGPTTTEDTVIFKKGEPVTLDVPDQLFGSSFTLVTNVSQTVGDYMVNSAMRLARLLESMRPFLRGVFGAKGFVIETSTDKPIFSNPNSI